MKRSEKKRQLRGFTLVELVVVLVILGVLVTLAVPRFTTSAARAKETAFCSNVRTIKSQLELYKMQTGEYPTTAQFVNPSTTTPNFLYNNDYFESAPVNPYTNKAFTVNDTGEQGTGSGAFVYSSDDGTTYTITTPGNVCSGL